MGPFQNDMEGDDFTKAMLWIMAVAASIAAIVVLLLLL